MQEPFLCEQTIKYLILSFLCGRSKKTDCVQVYSPTCMCLCSHCGCPIFFSCLSLVSRLKGGRRKLRQHCCHSAQGLFLSCMMYPPVESCGVDLSHDTALISIFLHQSRSKCRPGSSFPLLFLL